MEITLPSELTTAIARSQARSQRIVIMTCGVAGSGKSTLAKQLIRQYPNFTRLSIDAYIFANHGAYGVDYPPEVYSLYQDEARAALILQFRELMREGTKNAVVDLSFWSRAERERWRGMVVESGRDVRVILVFFDPGEDKARGEEMLWRRIEERARGVRDADGIAVVRRELLRDYVRGFERPGVEEGEVVIIGVE